MKSVNRLYLILLAALAAVGCVPVGSTITPTQTQKAIPSPTIIQMTSTPVVTVTETSTISPRATLESEQAQEAISKLLGEPIDCEAPCFWGIRPGQTTLGEAKDVFAHLGLQTKSITYQGKDFYGIRQDFDSGLSIIVTLTIQDEIVTDLRIDIVPEPQKMGVPREWLAYSPETLIDRYGPPSRVDFVLDWGPSSFFDMAMYFDSVDLIVEYDGNDIIPRKKGSPQICPLSAQFDDVRIWMGKDPVNSPPRDVRVPLEKATSMTIEGFSRLMTGSSSGACFRINGDVFP